MSAAVMPMRNTISACAVADNVIAGSVIAVAIVSIISAVASRLFVGLSVRISINSFWLSIGFDDDNVWQNLWLILMQRLCHEMRRSEDNSSSHRSAANWHRQTPRRVIWH
jgi:hypothetical protein